MDRGMKNENQWPTLFAFFRLIQACCLSCYYGGPEGIPGFCDVLFSSHVCEPVKKSLNISRRWICVMFRPCRYQTSMQSGFQSPWRKHWEQRFLCVKRSLPMLAKYCTGGNYHSLCLCQRFNDAICWCKSDVCHTCRLQAPFIVVGHETVKENGAARAIKMT